MQADNVPLPEEIEKALPPDSAQRLRLGSGASILRFLKNNILKPKPPTEIHSGSLSEAERDKTLAPFAISGVEVGRVNRDYEAFFTSAWGGGGPARPTDGASNSPHPPSAPPGIEEAVRQERVMTKQERPTAKLPVPPTKPRSKTGGDVIDVKEQRDRPATSSAHSPVLPRANIGAPKRAMLPPSGQQVPVCSLYR
jgi:hypothetical protein